MTIGSIVVDLLARTGSFETDMNRSAKLAEKRAKEIDAAVTAAGAAIGVALGAVGIATAALVGRTVETLASFKDLSDKVGDTAEQLATLQTALTLSGTSADTFAAASIKLTSALAKTDDESKAVGTALSDIGLEFEAFKKLSPVQQIDAVATAMATWGDGAEKTATAVALFGKSGAELIPFLNDLAEGGERQVRITQEQIEAADEFSKGFSRLRAEFDAFVQTQTAGLIPALTQVQQLLADLARSQATVDTITATLNGTIQAATVVFQTLAVVASDVGFVFLGVGREVGAIIAQLDALVRMDFSGFTAISEAVKEDGRRARAELDAFQARVMAIGRPEYSDDETRRLAARARANGEVMPRISVTPVAAKGASKKDNSAAQEAKAQLALDLEDIKKATAALSNAFDNREKILSAQRSASLIGETEYFEERRRLQIESDQLEEEGLQKSINRLQKEQGALAGKEAIDNQRKLNDAISDLAKARANAAANLKVLDIQAADSAANIARAFADARDAAQSFLDVTNKARDLEVSGMGQGGKSRDLAAALNQIEQTYDQKRQDLERDNRNGKFAGRQADYERELALIQEFQKKSIDSYKEYYAQIELRQQSFTLGASEAARNYFDESQNVFKQTEEAVSSAFAGMEEALVNFVKTGKLDFKSLVDSIISDIARIVIKQQITGPLAGLLSSALGGLGGAGGGGFGTGAAFGNQDFGGFFAAGGSPPVGKVSIVGERGPELFVPNTAGRIVPNHELASGAGGGTTNNYFTVGDVASMAEVKKVVAASQAQSAGRLGRSRTYGGAFS